MYSKLTKILLMIIFAYTVMLEQSKKEDIIVAKFENQNITLKEFELLTDDQKASIESIDTKIETKTTNEDEQIDVKYIKIKLHSKQSALAEINKMQGYYAAENVNLDNKITITVRREKKPPIDER